MKVVGLLAYLALGAPGRYQRRDRLCGLLWQELDQSHARTSVRKAVFAARRVLGTAALELYRGELMPGFHLAGCAEFGSWLDGERSSVAQHACYDARCNYSFASATGRAR